MITYVYPKNVLTETEKNVKNLLKKQPLQIGLGERKTTIFNENEYIILDFGKELCGGVRIFTYRGGDIPVRIRFGESLTEVSSELGGKTNATNNHSLRDFTVNLQSYSDMTFGQTGFRYVRIDFYGKVEIKSIVAAVNELNKKAIYTYNGNDARIREIFDVAKRTIDLCATSGYVWDGIKRDRLVWIGDMAPEVLALTTLYGRVPEIERSLNFVKDQTPLPGWMNGYPMYSMWWIIVLDIYYEKAGAKEYIKKQIKYLIKLLNQMDGCVLDDGELNYPSYFLDWQTHDKPEEKEGVRAINILAIKSAIKLLSLFNEDTSKAEELLYRLMKKEINGGKCKQVLALKHFAVGISKAEQDNLIEGGAKGMSTFMSYYMLKAVASFNKNAAIEMMKEYYGGMLDKGATTFWEDFDIEWTKNSCRIDELPKNGEKDIHGDFGAYCYTGFRHSLCHGWSAGIIAFMEEEKLI